MIFCTFQVYKKVESESGYMHRFNFWLRKELFDRIANMAKHKRISITKMFVELLEIGYIAKLGGTKN